MSPTLRRAARPLFALALVCAWLVYAASPSTTTPALAQQQQLPSSFALTKVSGGGQWTMSPTGTDQLSGGSVIYRVNQGEYLSNIDAIGQEILFRVNWSFNGGNNIFNDESAHIVVGLNHRTATDAAGNLIGNDFIGVLIGRDGSCSGIGGVTIEWGQLGDDNRFTPCYWVNPSAGTLLLRFKAYYSGYATLGLCATTTSPCSNIASGQHYGSDYAGSAVAALGGGEFTNYTTNVYIMSNKYIYNCGDRPC